MAAAYEGSRATHREKRRPRRLRAILVVTFALILTWQVISHSLAAYLADSAPEQALRLNGGQPTALLNLAEQEVDKAPPSQPRASDRASQATTNAPRRVSPDNRNFIDAFSAFKMFDPNATTTQTMASEQRAISDQPSKRIGGFPEESSKQIRAWTESALREGPLSARAFRILGQLADLTGNEAGAEKFMRVAASHSLSESMAVYWMLRRSLQTSDYPSVLYYADVLLRTRPDLSPYVVPLLAQMAERKDASAELSKLLGTNPSWRAQFLSTLPLSITDARTPLNLLLSLRTSAHPPTVTDLGPYLAMLIDHKLYDLAYYTWLQFLSPDELRHAGLLFNGNFLVPPSGLPFDWVITPGSGVTIDIVPLPDQSGERALFVDFLHGRVQYQSITQLIVLSPGAYRFTGKYKGNLVGPRGLKWRIACAGGASAPLSESDVVIGAAPTWKAIDFKFTIPGGNCRAQYIKLDLDARMASEQLITGPVWFGELSISRIANGAPSGPK